MNPRRIALDAGVIAFLGLVTAFLGDWPFVVPSAGVADKVAGLVGGHEALRAELTLWWAATAVGTASMLVRSRFPLVALAGATAMTLVHFTSDMVPLLAVDLAAPIALSTVAATASSRRTSYVALAVMAVLASGAALVAHPGEILGLPDNQSYLPPVAVVLAWAVGDRARIRRAYLEQATQRARDLERDRDRQADLAAATERARIARELHDAVAHGLSVIVIQAQAAAGTLDRQPRMTRRALADIVTTGRDSLAEMRRLLGLVSPDGPELAPLPGLDDLEALVQRVRAAGLPVTLRRSGEPNGLPTGVGLSAYRIIQEALTNVLKHAGPEATVEIDLRCAADGVDLTVADTGHGAGGTPDERGGNGLRGMRERVAMLGGTLAVGDGAAGGFQVAARLPAKAPS